MGRAQRFTYAGALHHVTMRCNNKEFLFDEHSFQLFLDMLLEARDKFEVRLYNYCLMTNHFHLLFDVPTDNVLSSFMHRVANGFARRFNSIHQRKGHLWEGRFRSTIVEGSAYFFQAMAYIDLNPVRARMAAKPGDYRWSGHRHIAAQNEAVIPLHKAYLELGENPRERYRAYMRAVREEAARPPYSLAGTLFVGSKRFIWKMRRRFSVSDADDESPGIQLLDLGDNVQAAELRRARKAQCARQK